jgi:ParB-like chromosome segregation protein Spo0J
MRIEKKKLSELKAAPYNPRIDIRKDDETYQKLRRSIKKYGLVEPIVWNEKSGYVVGGHQRVTVLKDLDYKEIEVVVVNLSPNDEKALNIALNKIVGDWDMDKLNDILEELKFDDAFDNTGFSLIELEEIKHDLDKMIESDNVRENREVTNYNIIFNDIDEKIIFDQYIKYVKEMFPSKSIGKSIICDIIARGIIQDEKKQE